MKQHLGKLILLILFTAALFSANVSLTVNTPAIYKGDSASFTIRATGDDITFPKIEEIEGFPVHQSGTSSSYSNINGKTSKSIAKTYRFSPTKSVTIPALSVMIDGKSYTTQAKKISLLEPKAGKSGDPYILELKVGKKELKVGESTELKITYKQRVDAKVNRVALSEPKIDNFWVKKIGKQKQYVQGEYVVTEYRYLIFAQKSGRFHIDPIVGNIGRAVQSRMGGGFFNDPFFNSVTTQLEWKKIYSNPLNLTVQPLPDNLELYGDFTILANVDKRVVDANKPVNLTIRAEGVGNIDDVQKFDLNIDNAVVYADKPVIHSSFKNGKYQGEFIEKVAIIGDRNYTIPAITLRFFSAKENKVKTVTTKPIAIEVKGSPKTATAPAKVETLEKSEKSKEQPKIESQNMQKSIVKVEDKKTKYIYLAIGFILGALVTYFLLRLQKRETKSKENGIIKQIKNAKDDKKLFDILLPYANESSVISDTLKALEENIYKKANNTIEKQRLYDYFFDREESEKTQQ